MSAAPESTAPPAIDTLLDEASRQRAQLRHGEVLEPRGDEASSLLGFLLAGIRLALPARLVESVLRGEPPTRIPRTPLYIAGLIPHAEQALPLLDLGLFLGLSSTAAGQGRSFTAHRVLVVEQDGLRAGLLCDRALGVISGRTDGGAEVMQGGRLREFVTAEFDHADGRVAVLDVGKLFDAARLR